MFFSRLGSAGQDRLRWLILTVEWLTQYDPVALTLEAGGPFYRQADIVYQKAAQGDPDHRLDEGIWELLREAPLRDAMLSYARKIESRGELGVLATINVKAMSTYDEASYAFGTHRGNWPPDGVCAFGSDDSAVVEWKPSVSAEGYRVWRREV